jgi:hypothetical protein
VCQWLCIEDFLSHLAELLTTFQAIVAIGLTTFYVIEAVV